MDISEMWAYRDALSMHKGLQRLDARNQSLSQANPNFDRKTLVDEDASTLLSALSRFQFLAQDPNPFSYYSKLHFAEQLQRAESCEQELLLRYITDRSFYFAEYRDHGNLLGDGREVYPFPSLKSLALYDTSWKLANKTDHDLLRESRDKIKNLSNVSDAAIHEAESCIDEALMEDTTSSCSIHTLKSKLTYSLNSQLADLLLYPYQALLENRRRARKACKNKWLPTTAHFFFWQQSEDNHITLCEAFFSRQADLSMSNRIVKELNQLAISCQRQQADNFPEALTRTRHAVIALFEIYVRSLLHAVRNPDYLPILLRPAETLSARPYTEAITRLLSACHSNGRWHYLTPLFLYHAFADNTKVILQNAKPRLVRKIRIISCPARIKNMTSMTGRRAAVNLVLYNKLLTLFNSMNRKTCLFKRAPGTCSAMPANDLFKSKMVPDGCYDKSLSEKDCPFIRTEAELNDFGFALTSGYANLQHHRSSNEDQVNLTFDEIYPQKDAEFPTQSVDNTPGFPVFQYHFDFSKPVGTLEGLLALHIQNCIPNQPRYLSPVTPNSYRRNDADPFFSPYEELASILLQDMHLPAMLRICRKIKKIISLHPNYLETYRALVIKPTPTGELTDFLRRIIQKHGLDRQAAQYSYYQISGRAYNIRDCLQGILEYELRAQIYEQASHSIADLVANNLDRKLFLYPPEDGLLRMIKEPIR